MLFTNHNGNLSLFVAGFEFQRSNVNKKVSDTLAKTADRKGVQENEMLKSLKV